MAPDALLSASCPQLLGGYGYLRDYPPERYFRDLRVHSILEGKHPDGASCSQRRVGCRSGRLALEPLLTSRRACAGAIGIMRVGGALGG